MKILSSFAFNKSVGWSFPLILLILFASGALARPGLRCIRHNGGPWITHVTGNATLARRLGIRAADPLRATATVRFSCLRNAAAGDTSVDTVYFVHAKQGRDTAVLIFATVAPASPDTVVLLGRCELSTGVLASSSIPHVFSFAVQAVGNGLAFSYGLPVACRVDLEIYDALGRAAGAPVKEEVQETRYYRCEWATIGHPKGVYFCTFTAVPMRGQSSEFTRTQRVVIR